MSTLKPPQSTEQIEEQLQTKNRQMQSYQQNTNYVDAQKCRLAIQQLKKDYQNCKLNQLQFKHRRETAQLSRTHDQQLQTFNKQWDKRFEQFYTQGQKHQKDMLQKHERQLDRSRIQLQQQISSKLKQSSQLLNLRKMQQHMAKQKNYIQAQRVKQKCNQLQKQQKQIWNNGRNFKIQAGLNKIKQKQQIELNALLKKIKQGIDQLDKQRKQQLNVLNLKYSNICKELRMQQDKQIIAHKGQFRTKGGSTSSPQMTKSKIGVK